MIRLNILNFLLLSLGLLRNLVLCADEVPLAVTDLVPNVSLMSTPRARLTPSD